jgi:hypothetical protein
MSKSAQRQFLVKVSGIDGYFMTKTGGNVSADTTKVYDGGEPRPDVLSSPADVENVTVSRAYDHQRDADTLARMRGQVGKLRTTVSVTPTDEDLVANGNPVVYSDALLVGFTDVEVDASGGDAATFELEFAVGSIG